MKQRHNQLPLNALQSVFIVGLLHVGAAVAPAQERGGLPPNWKAGGKTREGYFHEEHEKRDKRKQKQKKVVPTRERTSSEAVQAEDGQAEFEPTKTKSRRSALTFYGSSPEILRLDYNYSFSSRLAFTLALSGPFPVDVEVSMPSDIIKSDRSQTIAVAYPAFDVNFKVDWGPYIHTGIVWYPFGGRWYTSLTGGMRSIKIKGSAQSQLRICTVAEAAKEPPCGNDNAAITTRNKIAINADIKLLSSFARLTTGWTYNLNPTWAMNAELGLFAPLKTSESSDVSASIVAPDGTPEDLSGAIGELRAKSEDDLADKAESELRQATKSVLPVLALGISCRF